MDESSDIDGGICRSRNGRATPPKNGTHSRHASMLPTIPETASRWHELGHEAGFSNVQEAFASPTDLFRMYTFRA
jgi:hypothetical protein